MADKPHAESWWLSYASIATGPFSLFFGWPTVLGASSPLIKDVDRVKESEFNSSVCTVYETLVLAT